MLFPLISSFHLRRSLSTAFIWLLTVLVVAVPTGCDTDDIAAIPASDHATPDRPDDTSQDDPEAVDEQTLTRYAVNMFAANTMGAYYLWADEIRPQIDGWLMTDDPETKVAEIRYKDGNGQEIDHWTTMTDDYAGFTASTAGIGLTFGYDLNLCYLNQQRTAIGAVVNFTYAGSPARQAGLERGDVILRVNGQVMTNGTYVDVVNNVLYGSNTCTLQVVNDNGKNETLILTPVSMYEDPVLTSKVFECRDKKIGYLCYSAFTPDSWTRLKEVCREFEQQGISELILDLRHNGGGYLMTEYTLASMLAPESDVMAGAVYETDVFNSQMTEYFRQNAPELISIPFRTDYNFTVNGKTYAYSTADVHTGIARMYVLVSNRTASASESLVCCMKPYLDVVVIGQHSAGKYCSGYVLSAEDWYEDCKDILPEDTYKTGLQYARNWGIYVMVGRYADKNGKTASMPDGLVPDLAAEEDIWDGYQLGDARETLLAAALQEAGYTDFDSDSGPETKSSMHNMSMHRLLPEAKQPVRAVLPGRIMNASALHF